MLSPPANETAILFGSGTSTNGVLMYNNSNTPNSKGMLTVNYSGLIPVLIESIKGQQTQIDELKKLVESIK